MKTSMRVVPATADTWDDLETLFGPKGAYAGCWCMFWRLERSEFKDKKGTGTQKILKTLTARGEVPGVLGYSGNEVVGWCSIGPREKYLALENSRILKRVDDKPVWAVVCFFVSKSYRKHNAMVDLLQGAVAYARAQGAKIVEGYPLDLDSPKLAGQNLNSYAGYMGIASAFKKAGFKEVGRASDTQLIMRLML